MGRNLARRPPAPRHKGVSRGAAAALDRARVLALPVAMAEPFKELFNPGVVVAMGGHLTRAAPGFDAGGFVAMACDGLERLELKARAAHIAAALEAHLPPGWAGVKAMLAALHPEADAPIGAMAMDRDGIRGWPVMPMADVVAARGLALGRFDAAMDALAVMTMRYSSEFAVRPLILADPDRALGHALAWTGHANQHVRRLASEGFRPRLPWGIRLAPFVAEPGPLLPLLARLRDDPEEYVRRSVANSLNDIAKDHPALVAQIAREWLAGASAERARLVRHALRSLVKAGHPDALAALGLEPVAIAATLAVEMPLVRFGEALAFAVTLAGPPGQRLEIDYAIHFPRADGRLAPKVFKLRRLSLPPTGAVTLARRHPMRPITTRRHRDGLHRLDIRVNGAVVAEAAFRLEGVGQREGTGTAPR
jgi:3-methyladenine DNA glycosylase AlkC